MDVYQQLEEAQPGFRRNEQIGRSVGGKELAQRTVRELPKSRVKSSNAFSLNKQTIDPPAVPASTFAPGGELPRAR